MTKKKLTTITHDNYEIEVDSLIPKHQLASANHRFQKFLNIAKTQSEISNYYKYKLGAVLVIKGRVIARGYNSAKSHPIQKRYNMERLNMEHDSAPHHLHAEMEVLTKARGVDLRNAEIFVYHINAHGDQKMARPCAACMKAIKEHGVCVIHYSTPDGFATEYLNPEEKTKVKHGRSMI
jgi:deoxycytidylate deaminase